MAKSSKRTKRQQRYDWLRSHHLTPAEARELCVLPKATPALREIISERDARWEKFKRLATTKVSRGKWRERDLPAKWTANLLRLYRKNHWRVQQGPTGKQKKMAKGAPNPWSMYRSYEKVAPGKNYVSPWEVKQVRGGKTPFDRGQIFVQKAEKGARSGAIKQWISQLTESIKLYPAQREQFEKQRERLRGML